MERISARQVQSSERFYRIPKIFVESPLYKPMSTDAKFTYAILKDRFELSLRNNWIDKNGDVYLIYQFLKHSKWGNMVFFLLN